jgi:Amt family ammonium transporter
MEQVIELSYALDTFYFLISGALVMWMAAGFTMLEAGLVRSKSTAEILTKNIALYSIATVMFMVVGYNIMYSDGISSIIPGIRNRSMIQPTPNSPSVKNQIVPVIGRPM